MYGCEDRAEEVRGDTKLDIGLQSADFRLWHEEDFGTERASLVTAVDPLYEAICAKNVVAGSLHGCVRLVAANYAFILLHTDQQM